MLDPHQTIANVVLDHSECAQVFQRHRIDFCCHGDVSLADAALRRNVDLDALVAELAHAIDARGAVERDLRDLTTPELVTHIINTHHHYLRTSLPFVTTLAAKVSRVHGDHNPKLRELNATVQELGQTLLPHLEHEEKTLFPLLTAASPDTQALAPLLDSMLEEHRAVAVLLERVRAATEEFTLPEWACNSYRTLFSELEQLEGDTFTHVHLENHILRPRFAAS